MLLLYPAARYPELSCVLILLTPAAGYTSSGMAAALGVTLAALAWPALVAVPYLILVLFGLLQWSGGKGHRRISPQGCRMLQLYISARGWVVLHFLHLVLQTMCLNLPQLVVNCHVCHTGILLRCWCEGLQAPGS